MQRNEFACILFFTMLPYGWEDLWAVHICDVVTVVFVVDQYILRDLEKKKILVFTPSRRVGGKRVVCYDDRFIVKLAHESDGIVVSNDTYRDLQNERPEWKKFIEERLLMYSFVNDKYVPTVLAFKVVCGSLRSFLMKGG